MRRNQSAVLRTASLDMPCWRADILGLAWESRRPGANLQLRRPADVSGPSLVQRSPAEASNTVLPLAGSSQTTDGGESKCLRCAWLEMEPSGLAPLPFNGLGHDRQRTWPAEVTPCDRKMKEQARSFSHPGSPRNLLPHGRSSRSSI